MDEERRHATWVIVATFCTAYLLAVFPLPAWLAGARPEWVALVLLYWVIALPQRVGVMVAFCSGLLLDLIEGGTLGQHALSHSVLAFLALIMYQRVRVFNLWQQGAVVFILLGINQMLGQWVQGAAGIAGSNLFLMLPALMGAALWPGVLGLLRHLRRHYSVS